MFAGVSKEIATHHDGGSTLAGRINLWPTSDAQKTPSKPVAGVSVPPSSSDTEDAVLPLNQSGGLESPIWRMIRMSYKALKKLLIWERKQKKVGCPLPAATNMAEIEEVENVPLVLLPCSSCNRTFRPEALAKHSRVCEKTLMRKRKKFDSAKQRIAGTDLAQFVPNQSQLNLRKKPPSPKEAPSRWKEKHEQLVATLRSSRSGEVATLKKPADHEQCPYCERYFGPKPYDRHVDWCKEQQIKGKLRGDSVAKERLAARTKYQAPLFKSQRTLTKERFSPNKTNEKSPTTIREDSAYKTGSLSPSTRSKAPSVERPGPVRSGSIRIKSPTTARRRTPSVCSGGGSSTHSEGTIVQSPRHSKVLQPERSPRRRSQPPQRLSRRSPGETTGDSGEGEPSRFCHECGGRYPVPTAKFCCLCGVRRLAIA